MPDGERVKTNRAFAGRPGEGRAVIWRYCIEDRNHRQRMLSRIEPRVITVVEPTLSNQRKLDVERPTLTCSREQGPFGRNAFQVRLSNSGTLHDDQTQSTVSATLRNMTTRRLSWRNMLEAVYVELWCCGACPMPTCSSRFDKAVLCRRMRKAGGLAVLSRRRDRTGAAAMTIL